MLLDLLLMLIPVAVFFGPLAIITGLLEATIWKDTTNDQQ